MKRQPHQRVDYTDWTVEQHADYLRTQPTYQAYFANYSKAVVDFFISQYAYKKRELHKDKVRLKANYDEHRTIFLMLADRYIDIILQKKLLNLQCQWRAGLIELPHVFSCHDFKYWETCIRSCPLIAPITEEELQLCMRFLTENIDYQTDDWDDYDGNWQDYEMFKIYLGYFDDDLETTEAYSYDPDDDEEDDDEEDDEEDIDEEYPFIYRFFDKHQGTKQLFAARDVRLPIQERYMDEARRLDKIKREAEAKANGTWQDRESAEYKEMQAMYRDPNILNEAKFIEEAEDNDTKEAYTYKVYWDKIYDEEIDVENYIEFLTQFNERLEIEAHEDWRKAVEMTARRFRQKKIVDMLPYAYATYILEFDDELTPEEIVAQRVAHYTTDTTADDYGYLMTGREMILTGRASLEGIRDLNIF